MDDIIFVHPPAIYDFRKRCVHFGPISDVIPSTPVFDMYPLGFISLTSYLLRHNYRVSIVNLAALMVRDLSLNVGKLLSKLRARMFGVDLHWLVHVQGAISIVKLLKRLHPDTPVVVGGLSATYFHREVLQKVPEIDYVVLGDTAEDPLLALIEHVVEGKGSLHDVPGVAWREGGSVKVGRAAPCVRSLDKYQVDYRLVIRRAIASLNPIRSIPFAGFLSEPIGTVFAYKGCLSNCVACGGSNYAYSTYYGRPCLAKKSPRTLWEEVRSVVEYFKIPVFVVGDLQLLGRKWVSKFVSESREDPIDSLVILEFFTPASREYVKALAGIGASSVGFQISPESQDEVIRWRYGRLYGNAELEAFVSNTLEEGVKRLDLYFMVGLPGQDYASALGVARYMDSLYRKHCAKYGCWRLHGFVAPLAPFVDPGSLAYTYPEKYGYRLFARTLVEHYRLMDNARTWMDMLNYETEWMSRETIVKAAYDAARAMLDVKLKYGLITQHEFDELARTIMVAKEVTLRRAAVGTTLGGEIVPKGSLYPTAEVLRLVRPKLLAGVLQGFLENVRRYLR